MSSLLWLYSLFHLIINLTLYQALTALYFYHILLYPFASFFDFSAKLLTSPGLECALFTFVSQHWGHSLTWIYFTKYLLSVSCTDRTKLGQFPSCGQCQVKKKKKTNELLHGDPNMFPLFSEASSIVSLDYSIRLDLEKDDPVNRMNHIWCYWSPFSSWLSISQMWKVPKEAALVCCHLFQVFSLIYGTSVMPKNFAKVHSACGSITLSTNKTCAPYK